MENTFSHLKEGDKVILVHPWSKIEHLCYVESITPKGFIKIEGCLYNPNGYERTSDDWHRTYLKLATDEAIDEIRKKQIIAKSRRMMNDTANLTYEQAVKIIEALSN